MKILMHYRQDWHNEKGVPSYCQSFRNAFIELGHDVFPVGEGHSNQIPGSPYPIQGDQLDPNNYDMLLELDNGRNKQGSLGFGEYKEVKIPKAILFTDSHGQPDLHQKLARNYKHVFFAVWARRDLFTGHPSAHFLPNATDLQYFSTEITNHIPLKYDFGFFGSKTGLYRADKLIEFCIKNQWTYDVRQINSGQKPRFPFTAEAMGACKALFNRGQKHDLNLRVFESLVLGLPFICDYDPLNGMDIVFKDWIDYEEWKNVLCYEAYTFKGLEEAMKYTKENYKRACILAYSAANYIAKNHIITNRTKTILEIV
jgi:hypothetical protein